MPMTNETQQVTYIHPKEYYAVVKRRGKGKLGGEYQFNETIYPPFPWKKDEPAPKPKPKPQPVRKTMVVRVTEQDKAGFAALYRQDYTITQIAEISGWSKTTVFRHLNLMGLIRRQKKLTDSERAQIVNMARDGATAAKIAETIDVSEKTVYRQLHAVGIWKNHTMTDSRKKGEKMKADRNKLELALARACMMSYQLAEKAGIGRTTMSNIMAGWSVNPATLGRVSRALGVDVTDIMQQEG